jgi:hypothetical protein
MMDRLKLENRNIASYALCPEAAAYNYTNSPLASLVGLPNSRM